MIKELTMGLLAAAVCSTGVAEVVTFRNGVDTYEGAVDALFFAGEPDTVHGEGGDDSALNDVTFLSVDLDDSGFPSQAAIRYEDIFSADGGPIPSNPVSSQDQVIYAALEFFVVSQTSSSAEITASRILGPDQDRDSGSGVWEDDDTWNSLGGQEIEEEALDINGMIPLEDFPIAIGPSDTLAVDNEALDPREISNNDDLLGNPRGILPDELNSLESFAFGGQLRIDVTDSVQAWQNGETNLGWAISTTSGNGWDFYSSEFALDTVDPRDRDLVEAQIRLFLDIPPEVEVTPDDETQFRPTLRVAFGVNGDLNDSGGLDMSDFDLLRPLLGNQVATPGDFGDLNFDTLIDLKDFAVFKEAFDAENGEGAFALALSGAPEPAASLLLAGVLATLVVRRPARAARSN